MIAYITIGALVGLPLLLGILFRIHTSHLFFSLMAGELVSHYFGEEIQNIMESIFKDSGAVAYTEFLVLLTPMFLTAVFLHGTLKRGKLILHILPLAITGFVFTAFTLPMLPDSVQATVASVQLGRDMLELSDVIIAGVVVIQLITLWLFNRSKNSRHH